MDIMYGYIYVTVCDLNDLIYIGHRKWNKEYTDEEYAVIPQKEKDYFKLNLGIRAFPIDTEYLGSGKLLKEDFKKLGRQHFHVRVLEVCNSRSELIEREEYWISYYMDNNFPMYNLKRQGSMGFDPDDLGESAKEHFVSRQKEIGRTSGVSHFGDVSGERNGRYGKPVSDLTKLRISNANKGRVQSDEEREMRRIAHMTKCPDCKQPNHTGWITINNGVINKCIPPEKLSEYPNWTRGRIKRRKS